MKLILNELSKLYMRLNNGDVSVIADIHAYEEAIREYRDNKRKRLSINQLPFQQSCNIHQKATN